MTDTRYDRAPGDRPIVADIDEGTSSGVTVYTIGLVLAVVLTAVSFWVANTLLLFLVLRRSTGAVWPAAAVAALFALHPLHVESVAWIT